MSVTIERSEPRTAAALAARRRSTPAALDRIHDAINRLRREKTPVCVAAVARRAAVSRTHGPRPRRCTAPAGSGIGAMFGDPPAREI